LARIGPFHSGHFEQAMDCTGSFEIRRGPNAGEVRRNSCWSHRDHTGSDRFARPQQWQVREAHFASHYWPSIQLPDRHINFFGGYFENSLDPGHKAVAGFSSEENGSRPLLNATAEITPNDGTAAMRAAKAFGYREALHLHPDSSAARQRLDRLRARLEAAS
jgi:hypothetical protein